MSFKICLATMSMEQVIQHTLPGVLAIAMLFLVPLMQSLIWRDYPSHKPTMFCMWLLKIMRCGKLVVLPILSGLSRRFFFRTALMVRKISQILR